MRLKPRESPFAPSIETSFSAVEHLCRIGRLGRLDRGDQQVREVVRVHRVVGRLHHRPSRGTADTHLLGAEQLLVGRLEGHERRRPFLRRHPARSEHEPVEPLRMTGQLLAEQRVLGGRRRVHRNVPARAACGDHRLGDRRGLSPDEQRGRARAPRLQDLRRQVGRGRRRLDPGGDRVPVLGERMVERSQPLAPVAGVVGEEGDLQPLRDQVLGETERDAVVGRSDPEHVRPLRGVDEPGAAVEHDRRSGCGPGRRSSRRRRSPSRR